MKLEKFPVIAPDGTEYRVTIEHEQERNMSGDVLRECYLIRLYKRKNKAVLFRFKRVGKYWAEVSDFDSFVDLVEQTVLKYEDERESERQKRAKQADAKRKQAEALEAFRQWDGKIYENQTEVSE